MNFKFLIFAITILFFISPSYAEEEESTANTTTVKEEDMVPNAVNRNELETVKKMVLEEGRNASETDETGYNGLHNAARTGNVEIFKFLLDHGVNPLVPTPTDYYKRLPLHFAAQWGRTEIIKVLLGLKETNVNEKDGEGETPLTMLAGSSNEYSPDLDIAPVDFEGSLKALLAAGADKSIKNGEGKMPAELAAEKPALLKILNGEN